MIEIWTYYIKADPKSDIAGLTFRNFHLVLSSLDSQKDYQV